MSKGNKRLRLLTSVIALVMLLSTVMTIHLSANSGTYYGSSPSISDVTGSVDLGTEKLFNETVMYKLPDNVKESDDISIIVQMKNSSLLDAYDRSGSPLSFTDYVLTSEADEVRKDIRESAAMLREKLGGIDYNLGESYNVVMSGFELIIKAGDFADVCKAMAGKADVIVGEKYNPAETKLVENSVNV
jgi:hypothetical protein